MSEDAVVQDRFVAEPDMSGEIGKLAEALSKAQGKFEAAPPNMVAQMGSDRERRYASLSSVLSTVREALSENGLACVQLPIHADPGTVALKTILMHASGQWISSTVRFSYGQVNRANQNPAQDYGASLTYARRFALSAMLGIAQADDDAEGLKQPVIRTEKKSGQPDDAEPKKEFNQCLIQAHKALAEHGWTPEQAQKVIATAKDTEALKAIISDAKSGKYNSPKAVPAP